MHKIWERKQKLNFLTLILLNWKILSSLPAVICLFWNQIIVSTQNKGLNLNESDGFALKREAGVTLHAVDVVACQAVVIMCDEVITESRRWMKSVVWSHRLVVALVALLKQMKQLFIICF